MKQSILYISIIFFLLVGCNKSEPVPETPTQQAPDDGTVNPTNGNDNDSTNEGLITVTLNISLPENAIIDESDLSVSSLFTENSMVDSGMSNIDVYEGEGFEIAMAETLNGDLVLLNYFIPNTSQISMSARTTAIALVMIQSWTSILSIEAKEDLILQIQNLQEFQALVESIESSLVDDGTPLKNQRVLNDIKILSDLVVGSGNKDKSKIYFSDKEPLFLAAAENSISLKNASSLAYGIKYGEDVFKLDGVEKKVLTAVVGRIYDFFNNTESFQPTETKFTVVNNGYYEIDASNGAVLPSLQKSNAGDEVRFFNIGKIGFSFIETLTGAFDGPSSNSECLKNLGAYLEDKTKNKIYEISDERVLTELIIENMTDIALSGCIEIKKGSFLDKLLVSLKVINIGIGTIETSTLIKDWVIYNSEIDFCTSKINGEFQECQPFVISKQMAFGNIPTGLFGSILVEFENLSNNGFNITSIDFPNSYYSISIPSRGVVLVQGQTLIENLYIEAGEKLEVLISYDAKPINGAIYELSGDLSISTDLLDDSQNDLTYNFPISGAVINALELQDLNGNLITNLEFPATEINTYSGAKSVKILNNSDYEIVFPAASNSNPLDGFEYNWDEQIINASGGEIILDFRFFPKSAVAYNNDIEILTGTSQSLTLSLSGEGMNLDNPFSGAWSTVSYYYFEEFYSIGAVQQFNYLERCNLFLERERINFFSIDFNDKVMLNDIIEYSYSLSQSRAEDRFFLESSFECNEVRYYGWESFVLDDPLIIFEIVSNTHLRGRLGDEVLDLIINNENSMTIYVDRNVDSDGDEPPIYTYNLIRQ